MMTVCSVSELQDGPTKADQMRFSHRVKRTTGGVQNILVTFNDDGLESPGLVSWKEMGNRRRSFIRIMAPTVCPELALTSAMNLD